MTDHAARAERLAKELEAAFRNRADLYRLLLREMTAEFGRDRAEQTLVRVIEQRGAEVGGDAFSHLRGDAVAVGEAFLAASPDGGRLYPTHVERSDGSLSFKVRRCPLKEAWIGAGVNDVDLATLCRIAGAFDRGLFEAAGVAFANKTWTPGEDGCCTIMLGRCGAA
jgi:hypothetical protein